MNINMNKNFKAYAVIWAALFVIFNVVAFLVRPCLPQFEVVYDGRFWVAWVFIIIAFAGNLLCAHYVFREENLEKTFYRLPMVRLSYTCLVLMLVFGGIVMLIPDCPAAVSAIVCILILLLQGFAVIKASWAANTVEETEQKVKTQTQFIRLLTADAQSLLSRAKTDEAKAACKKVYEALRYSDPMSNDALSDIETEISGTFEAFAARIKAGENGTEFAEKLVKLIGERSAKCKVLK